MTLGRVEVGALFIWKQMVLEEASRAFVEQAMKDVQDDIGIWEHSADIRYPTIDEIKVVRNGCIIFNGNIHGESILFSLWMQPGEVRAGVKIPNSFIPNTVVRDAYRAMFNGEPCKRATLMGKHTFFDWIWSNEEFAGFDFMVRSIDDDMLASVLAERLSQILTHLYIATISTIIDQMKIKVGGGEVIGEEHDVWEAVVAGDLSALKWWLENNKGLLLKSEIEDKFDAKIFHCVFSFPASRRQSAEASNNNVICTADGDECIIVSLSKKNNSTV